MIVYFSLCESNTLGSLTTGKPYGLKGYSDSCPMYLATIGGWRLCLQSTSSPVWFGGRGGESLPYPYLANWTDGLRNQVTLLNGLISNRT